MPTMLEAFQSLWSRIYNPRSVVPDIEIDHVLNLMISTLASSQGFGPSDLSETERWVLASVAIQGTGHPQSIGFAYGDYRVSIFTEGETDENGYPKLRPYEETSTEKEALSNQVIQAVQSLLTRGLLVEDEHHVRLAAPIEN
jgi:hypothetical protein